MGEFSIIILIFFIISAMIAAIAIWFLYVEVNYTKIWDGTIDPKVPSDLKNCDLLFLAGNTLSEKAIRTYTNYPFSHVSMIFVEDGKPYLFESDIGQGYRDGCRVLLLKDKLSRWKGERIGMIKRYLLKRPSTNHILSVIRKHLKLTFDDTMLSWISPIFKRQDRVFCSEIVATVLKELNVAKIIGEPCSYSPAAISRLEGFSAGELFSF